MILRKSNRSDSSYVGQSVSFILRVEDFRLGRRDGRGALTLSSGKGKAGPADE